MGFWVQLGVSASLWLLSKALRGDGPKEEGAKQEEFKPGDFPRAEEGAPVPIVYGTVRVRSPNTIHALGFDADPFDENGNYPTTWVPGDVFGTWVEVLDEDAIRGYSYRLTVALALCVPSAVSTGVDLLKIWCRDRLFWEDGGGGMPPIVAGSGVGDFNIELFDELTNPYWSDFMGGRTKGGGFQGTVEFHSGVAPQTVSEGLEQAFDLPSSGYDSTLLSAYRGFSYVVFRGNASDPDGHGFTWGERPQLEPLSFEVRSIPNALTYGAIGANGDANPAEILYDIITNYWARLGFSSLLVDTTAFEDAAAILDAESHGMSVLLESASEAENVIAEILRQIDGVIFVDPDTWLTTVRLVRNDYGAVSGLPLLDESCIKKVHSLASNTWEECYNQVRVQYQDRAADYSTRLAVAQDLAGISRLGSTNGRIRPRHVSFPFLNDSATANMLAYRELRATGTPLFKAKLEVDRTAAYYKPGDPFRFSWARYGITDMVMRVDSVDPGSPTDPKVMVECSQDVWDTEGADVFETADPPDEIIFPPPLTIIEGQAMQAPRWFLAMAGLANPDTTRVVHLAADPGVGTSAFKAWVSTNGGTTWNVDRSLASFTPLGFLANDLVREEEPYDAAYTMVVEDFIQVNGVANHLLDSATISAAAIGELGITLLMVGEGSNAEFVAYEDRTGTDPATLEGIWRGLLDTAPRLHVAGERVWVVHFSVNKTLGTRDFGLLTTPDIDWTMQSLGSLFAGDFSTAYTGTAVERSLLRTTLPYPPARCQAEQRIGVNAGSPTNNLKDDAAFPTVFQGSTVVRVVENEALCTWARRDRTSLTIQRGDEADAVPTEPHLYFVDGEDGANEEQLTSGEAVAQQWAPFAPLKYGPDSLLRFRAYRDDVNRLAWQAPEVAMDLAWYRQLLRNPSFERNSLVAAEQWTDSGDGGGTENRFSANGVGGGSCFGPCDDHGTAEVEQVVSVIALAPTDLASGGYARMTFLARNAVGQSNEVTGTLEARNAADAVIVTGTSGPNVPGTTFWNRYTIMRALTAGNCDTLDDLRAHFLTDGITSTEPFIRVDEVDLRLGDLYDAFLGGPAAACLLNPTFDSNLTSWTVASGTWARATDQLQQGGGNAKCSVDGELNQTGTLPASYKAAGDVLHFQCWRWDAAATEKMEVVVEILNAANAVISSRSSGDITVFNATVNVWKRLDFYVVLPANSDKVKVRFVGNVGAGADSRVDDLQCWVSKARA